MNKNRWVRAGVAGMVMTAGVLGYAVHAARATVPATNALTYSGILLDTAGNPVNSGTQSIRVELFDAATGGTSPCTSTQKSIDFTGTAGAFQVTLNDNCVPAITGNASLFVEVSVAGTPLSPRTKLGAVPYAIEASKAATATSATTATTATTATNATNASNATGSLATTLTGLTTSIGTKADAAVTYNGKKYSLGAKYCGSTANSYSGAIGGYAAAKSLCETACGSASAHMCTSEEVVRSKQLGIAIPPGTNGYPHMATGTASTVPPNDIRVMDCNDWTSAQFGVASSSGYNVNTALVFSACNEIVPIACCD